MAQKAYIDIIDIDGQTLSDSKRNDIAFYTLFGDQNILMSAGSNVSSKLCITSNNIGIGTTNPRVKLDINSTDALQLPVGTVNDRNNFSTNWNSGQIRYNTVSQQFEGYGNNSWLSFGGISGVSDGNNDTYISAENGPGTNNDDLTFYTSNNQRMIISKSGNIGIGTATPSNKLHIIGDAQITSNVLIGGITTLNSNLIISGSNTLTIGTGSVNISGITTLNSNLLISGSNTLTTGTGSVNISGITTLNSNLLITGSNTLTTGTGSVNISGLTTMNSNLVLSGSNSINFVNSNNCIIVYSNNDLLLNNKISSGSIRLSTNNIEKITVNQNGNMGIGTSNPFTILHANSSNAIVRLQNAQLSNLNSRTEFYTSSNVQGFIGYSNSQDFLISNSASNGAMRLFSSNSERLSILTGGNIGIGSTIPGSLLDVGGSLNVAGNANLSTLTTTATASLSNLTAYGTSTNIAYTNAGNFFEFQTAAGANNCYIDFHASAGTTGVDYNSRILSTDNLMYLDSPTISFYTNNNEKMRLSTTGNVGIGTTNPISKLHVTNPTAFSTTQNLTLTNGGGFNQFMPQIAFTYGGSTQYNNYIGSRHNDGSIAGNALDFYFCTGSAANTISTGTTRGITFDSPGCIGIGQTAPITNLHIKARNNSTNGALSSWDQACIVFEPSTNAGHWAMHVNGSGAVGLNLNELCFTYEFAAKGYLDNSIDQAIIDFTGQHRNTTTNPFILNENIDVFIGLIVYSTGIYDNLSVELNVNEALPIVELTNTNNDKRVFGVISDKEDDNSSRTYHQGRFVSVYEKEETDTRLYINSLGEGMIYICDINGIIENGDYITSSIVTGYGMKQNDDLLHNYTVAKITQDCNFDMTVDAKFSRYVNDKGTIITEAEYNNLIDSGNNAYRCKMVGCTYHCG